MHTATPFEELFIQPGGYPAEVRTQARILGKYARQLLNLCLSDKKQERINAMLWPLNFACLNVLQSRGSELLKYK